MKFIILVSGLGLRFYPSNQAGGQQHSGTVRQDCLSKMISLMVG